MSIPIEYQDGNMDFAFADWLNYLRQAISEWDTERMAECLHKLDDFNPNWIAKNLIHEYEGIKKQYFNGGLS